MGSKERWCLSLNYGLLYRLLSISSWDTTKRCYDFMLIFYDFAMTILSNGIISSVATDANETASPYSPDLLPTCVQPYDYHHFLYGKIPVCIIIDSLHDLVYLDAAGTVRIVTVKQFVVERWWGRRRRCRWGRAVWTSPARDAPQPVLERRIGWRAKSCISFE